VARTAAAKLTSALIACVRVGARHGGCGGALYMDGADEKTSLCGITIRGSKAGAIGGAIFRVSNDATGSLAVDKSIIDDNRVTPTTDGNAGGLYLQGLRLSITATTISRNQAFFNGGLWINAGQVELTNTTVSDNIAFGSNGGGIWLANNPTGTITNATIANNKSTAANQIAGAIFGNGLAIRNSIIANNTAMYTPTCNQARADGSGNLQWPAGSLCTAAPTIADPMLAPLANNGGEIETLLPAEASPTRARDHELPADRSARHATCDAVHGRRGGVTQLRRR
jgi:parallel beta-helix repeat protein